MAADDEDLDAKKIEQVLRDLGLDVKVAVVTKEDLIKFLLKKNPETKH